MLAILKKQYEPEAEALAKAGHVPEEGREFVASESNITQTIPQKRPLDPDEWLKRKLAERGLTQQDVLASMQGSQYLRYVTLGLVWWVSAPASAALVYSNDFQAAVGSGQGLHAPAEALRQALAPCGRPPAEFGPRASLAACVTAGRELTLDEAAAITTRLNAGRAPAAPFVLGAGVEHTLGDEAHALLLYRAPASGNVVPLRG